MKGSLLNYFWMFFLFVALAKIFGPWLSTPEIIGGDWPYFFPEALKTMSVFSPSWNPTYGNGLGGPVINYTLDQYLHFTALFSRIPFIPWPLVYKIFWFLPVVLVSIYATARLHRVIFGDRAIWPLSLGILIFTTNTYIVMISAGGQMGIALAYACTPLVCSNFILLASTRTVKNTISAGLLLALQVVLDLRVAYITLVAVSLYYLLHISSPTLRKIFQIVISIGIPVAIAMILHAAWTLPLLVLRQHPFQDLGQSYTDPDMVKFLSFSDFSHSLALLHPNWPENIFGKVYFMQPEFLLLPILAFSGLLFLGRVSIQLKKRILFFAVLALLGSFLAKGTSLPLGEVYVALFERIPGFVLFRDPTKFYILVSLSFSILIPFTLWQVSAWISKKRKIDSRLTLLSFALVFVILWGVLIREALQGKLGGTFQKHDIPAGYVVFKDFLDKQPQFFRVLTVPRWQRFIYATDRHPLVDASYLFNVQDISLLVGLMSSSQDYLSQLSVKYIIVPDDSLGEIFLTDRSYDETKYISVVKSLEAIPWIRKVHTFGKVVIFETRFHHDRFWVDRGEILNYEAVHPTRYVVDVKTDASSILTSSESYDPRWAAVSENATLPVTRSEHGLMSVAIPAGTHRITLTYRPETYYVLGRSVTIVSITILLFYLLLTKKRQVTHRE